MNCTSCGTQLPAGARVCPNCGVPTAAYYSSTTPSGPSSSYTPSYGVPPSPSQPYGAPPPSSQPYAAPPPVPPTVYGSNPYPMAPTDPYSGTSNPYAAPVVPSPPPARRNTRLGIIIGTIVLVLILIGAGVFVVVRSQRAVMTPTPVPTHAPIPPAQATQTALQNLFTQVTSRTPAINASLQGPDNFGWDRSNDSNHSCTFTNGSYHTTAKPGYFSSCFAESTNFRDCAIQVEITILSGHSGGIVFRGDSSSYAEYQFRISTDGTYILNKSVPASDGTDNFTPLASGTSKAINMGNNQNNVIAVIAQGSDFYLYINKQFVDRATDSSYTSGAVGVYVDSDADSVEAAFNNFEVWKL